MRVSEFENQIFKVLNTGTQNSEGISKFIWVILLSSQVCELLGDCVLLMSGHHQATVHLWTEWRKLLLLLLLLSQFSRVWLCATPETAAHWAAPSMGFSRQEYWSGVPLPSLEWRKLKGSKYSSPQHTCPLSSSWPSLPSRVYRSFSWSSGSLAQGHFFFFRYNGDVTLY